MGCPFIVSLLLAMLAGQPIDRRIGMIEYAARSTERPTVEFVYLLLGRPDETSTFGPPGDYVKYLEYSNWRVIVAVGTDERVLKGGLVRMRTKKRAREYSTDR
jgi:hypothetical protein